MWISLEGIISSFCGAPLVGLLSDLFGKKLQHHEGGHVSADVEHADDIRTSLMAVSMIPWVLCFLAWVPMYWTYPRDRAQASAASMASASDSEVSTNPSASDSEEESSMVE